MTVVCVIDQKMYKKTFEKTQDILDLYEMALNTDENNPQEVEDLIQQFTPEKTVEEIEYDKVVEEAEQQKDLISWLADLSTLDDEHFEVVGTKLYMKGINITIPEFLAVEFSNRRNNAEDLSSLMNFWRRMALNPDPRCREDLYKFLINNKITVTSSGYFVAYRNANIKNSGTDEEFNEFVNLQYAKTKSHKKSPKNFEVYFNNDLEEYVLVHVSKMDRLDDEFLEHRGNLLSCYEVLQEDSENQTVYTDAHSGSTTIIIGKPVKIDREECDANPDRTCSRGLHLGSTNFMTQGYFGSVGLVCLCDPMDVVAVPYTDGQKLRTSEYLPIAIAEYDEHGKIIPVATETFEYEYAKQDQAELEELLKNATLESLKEHNIIPKEISLIALRASILGLRESLDEMTEVIKNRIKTV
jgi:hypothetical protein